MNRLWLGNFYRPPDYAAHDIPNVNFIIWNTDIGNQMGCCGKNTDVAGSLVAERMEECAKADVIVVGCPMCLVKYDALPEGKPVVHISELVAMASGDKKSLGYHTVPIP